MTRRRYADPEDAFLARTEPLLWTGCLIWTGAVSSGYGRMYVEGRLDYAHRYAWEQENGPIPDGMRIDHRYHCSPLCCEPSHLRLATMRQNNHHRRGANRDNRSTGLLNIYRRESGRFAVRIEIDGKCKSFGTFDTVEEAVERRNAVRRERSGSFAGRGIA